MPAAEVDVTVDLVRRLVHDQHRDLADLALTGLANGWDNVMFRLGDDLTVRVPRREMAAQLVLNEAEWLRGRSARLPIAIPEPIRVGRPTRYYPWPWTICPYIPGRIAADSTLADPAGEARRLGAFLAAFHVPVPDGGPANPFRGMPLRDLDERVRANVERLGGLIDGGATVRRWGELSSAPEWDGPPILLHGDLHTANMLVADGRISGVIDFGDITAGDPACDFAVAWMLFDAATRTVFRTAVGDVDDATWRRAEAWALHFALLYVLNSADNPLIARMGRELLAALGL